MIRHLSKLEKAGAIAGATFMLASGGAAVWAKEQIDAYKGACHTRLLGATACETALPQEIIDRKNQADIVGNIGAIGIGGGAMVLVVAAFSETAEKTTSVPLREIEINIAGASPLPNREVA
jgi:hypothetical protein